MPTPLTTLYCSVADVQAVISVCAINARLDDDDDGAISTVEQNYLTVTILNWATAQVNRYLAGRYDYSQLVQDWSVNQWTAEIAALELCRRRGNPAPKSLADRVGIPDPIAPTGHYATMDAIRQNVMSLHEISERQPSQPAWSNVRVDIAHPTRRIRVERPLSETTPRSMPVQYDLPSDMMPEPL